MSFKKNFLTKNEKRVSISIDYNNNYCLTKTIGQFKITIEKEGYRIAEIVCNDIEEDPIIFSPDGHRQIPENAEKLFNDFKHLCNL